MRISLDGGGLCVPRTNHFGTKTFTLNIIQALQKYDTQNKYVVYSFCKRPNDLNLEPNVSYKRLMPKIGWMKLRVSAQEIMQKSDIFFALSQGIPWYTPARVFTFIHGLSYFHFKDLYKDSFDHLKHQLFFSIMRSETLFVSSELVKEELENKFKHKNVVVLPLGVPIDMQPRGKRDVKQFFLFVGMNHPIKQIKFLIDAFMIFKEHPAYKDFELYLVGNHHEYENKAKGIVIKSRATRADLKKYYEEATSYVSASLYESFNFPVLEALATGCPVIAKSSAIIPEMNRFVNRADVLEDFVNLMKQAAQDKLHKVQVEEVAERFDWEKTVSIISSHYGL